MKKILAILLSLLTLLSCGLLSACSAEKTQPDTPDTETVWETVSEAYIYAFPLVLTDATKTLSTNTDGTMTGRAPINQFNHAQKLADASFRTVVTPNVDTVYSQAWLDIREEPMIFVLPETDRFCNVQLLDAWTNTAAVLDKAGAYAIALPGWVGELPDGYRTVFNLYCIEGYSHRDIAQMLGINEKSSSSQLFRARTLLARRIAAYMETH